MPPETDSVAAARHQLALARAARAAAIRHLVEREKRLWAPLIHTRKAELAAALAKAANPERMAA